MNVYVAIYEHRHGRDVSVFNTAESAEALRQRIAADWWETEMQGADMPEDPSIAADDYFGTVDGEYFDVQACEVTP